MKGTYDHYLELLRKRLEAEKEENGRIEMRIKVIFKKK